MVFNLRKKMKKILFLVLVLFSVSVFCMEPDEEDIQVPMTQGEGNSRGRPPFLVRWVQSGAREDADQENNPNNAYNHYKYNVNFVSQAPPKDRNFTERTINAWNQGMDQVIAQIPLLIASALINEALNGFPVCSKITELWSENINQENEEIDHLSPQLSSIQNTNAEIQVLEQLITRLENVMDPDNINQLNKLEKLKRGKKELVDTLFDETLKFKELIRKEKAASAA